MLLSTAVERYIREVIPTKAKATRPSQAAQLRYWLEALGDRPLSDIRPVEIVDIRESLLRGSTHQSERRSTSTVLKYLAVLSHLFTVAIMDWEAAETNPLRRVRKPRPGRGRTRYLKRAELRRLLRECRESKNARLYPIVLTTLVTGMRKSEVKRLEWSDVDEDASLLVVREAKNGRTRAVPVPTKLITILFRLPRGSRWLFPGNFRTAFEMAVGRAGLHDFHFHDLRHTAASHLAMTGAEGITIATILGHSTVDMTMRYAHLNTRHTGAAIDSMVEVLGIL